MPFRQEQKQQQKQERQPKTFNNEKIKVAAMGKILALDHGIQSVQSGRHAVTAVAFECHGKSQGGKRMFVATEQGEATVWPSAKVGHEGHDIYCSPQPKGKVITCHFEGNRVATGYADGTCMVYNGNNGKKIMDTSPRHPVRGQRNPGKITTCKRFRVHFCISFLSCLCCTCTDHFARPPFCCWQVQFQKTAKQSCWVVVGTKTMIDVDGCSSETSALAKNYLVF